MTTVTCHCGTRCTFNFPPAPEDDTRCSNCLSELLDQTDVLNELVKQGKMTMLEWEDGDGRPEQDTEDKQ